MPSAVELDPSDPYARERQTFPILEADYVERLKDYGDVENCKKNSVLFERGDRTVDFFVIIKGNIEIYEHQPSGTKVFTIHKENQFTGELDLLNDRKILVGGRMGEDGTVIRIKRSDFKRLLVAEPDIAEIIIRAFILRRVGLISHEQGSVTLITDKENSDSMRIERFIRRNGYPVQILDCHDEAYDETLTEHQLEKTDLPAVIVHLGNAVLKNPSNYKLAEALGLTERPDTDILYDVMIVGGGPSGLSAAVYAASEGLNTVLLEKEAPGGQAATSSKIENYLGFPTGVSGQALAGRAQVQAMKFGAKIILPHTVKSIQKETDGSFSLKLCDERKLKTRSVVIATGATYRKLNIKDGEKFDNAGVYYAATSMEADLCRNEEVIIVGGGNSAGQAAVFLSRHASHVHILVRGDNLASSMSDYLINRIDSSPKITLHTHSEITKLEGKRHLQEVTISNKKENKDEVKNISHVFLMIGAMPNTDWVEDFIQLDSRGFICTGAEASKSEMWQLKRFPMMFETSAPGIFATGDVRSGSIKRVASGVGEGSITVSQIHQYLANL